MIADRDRLVWEKEFSSVTSDVGQDVPSGSSASMMFSKSIAATAVSRDFPRQLRLYRSSLRIG